MTRAQRFTKWQRNKRLKTTHCPGLNIENNIRITREMIDECGFAVTGASTNNDD